jgi:hypothetical protein
MNLRSSYDVATSSSHWVLTNNEFPIECSTGCSRTLNFEWHGPNFVVLPLLLLIGRYLIDAHHVENKITGPQGAPFAQKLSLGWVIVGEICIGKFHKADAIWIHWKRTCSWMGEQHYLIRSFSGFLRKLDSNGWALWRACFLLSGKIGLGALNGSGAIHDPVSSLVKKTRKDSICPSSGCITLKRPTKFVEYLTLQLFTKDNL